MMPILRLLSRPAACLLVFLLGTGTAAAADSLAVVPPALPGPYAVGCSNVEQDFTRLQEGEDAQSYWSGFPRSELDPRYVTQLLVDANSPLNVDLAVPYDPQLYGNFAGKPLPIPYLVLVCYPTPASNPRPDYELPNGNVVPHMQVSDDAPIWVDGSARYPIVLFAHGLGDSPLEGSYLQAMSFLASQGYVVVAPFFGDGRFISATAADLANPAKIATAFPDFVTTQALRALMLSRTIDRIIHHHHYAGHVDPVRIGAFGASLGAESALLLAGAGMTVDLAQSYRPIVSDPRVLGIVGYVPYFGQPQLSAFGPNAIGLRGMTVPFMGIAGTADTIAPLAVTTQGVRQLFGSRVLVTLDGVGHGFEPAAATDIYTWALTFFDAHLKGSGTARAQLTRMQSVAGGGRDATVIDYTAPTAPAANERAVVEYFRGANGHFFITGEPAEAAMLDAGVQVPGWTRTGYNFKSYVRNSGKGTPTCRFFGTPGVGPDSHFYTLDAAECAAVKNNPAWTYEGIAFDAQPSFGGDCAPDRIPVIRLYNNGQGGQANHRYLTSRSEIARMVAAGWVVEGGVFCGVP